MVDTSHVLALGCMEMVNSRDAAILSPIISNHILPGIVLWSDKWTAYNIASTVIPGVVGNQSIIHSLHFKNPITGVHTTTIKSYWNR